MSHNDHEEFYQNSPKENAQEKNPEERLTSEPEAKAIDHRNRGKHLKAADALNLDSDKQDELGQNHLYSKNAEATIQ